MAHDSVTIFNRRGRYDRLPGNPETGQLWVQSEAYQQHGEQFPSYCGRHASMSDIIIFDTRAVFTFWFAEDMNVKFSKHILGKWNRFPFDLKAFQQPVILRNRNLFYFAFVAWPLIPESK